MNIVLKNTHALFLTAVLFCSCKGKPIEEQPTIPTSSKPVTEQEVNSIEDKDTFTTDAHNSPEIKPKDTVVPLENNSKTSEENVESKKVKSAAQPKIDFSTLEHNFGKIIQDSILEYKFEFENKGNAPLIINNAVGSCGCAIASYPFIPIAPGEKGSIGVRFNSIGKMGLQNPTIAVISNSESKKVTLHLKGIVVPKPKN